METLMAPMVEPLTKRERDIVKAVAAGEKNKDIARRLGITEQTVKNHLNRIYQKAGVENRVQLAVAMNNGDL